MKFKSVLSLSLCLMMLIPQTTMFAEEADVTADEEIKRVVSYSEDFRTDLSGWSDNDDFYVLNQELVFNNKNKNHKGSMMISSSYTVKNDEIEFDLTAEDGGYFTFLFRVQDENTHYALRFYHKNNKVLLLKKIGGGSYKTLKSVNTPLEYGETNRIGVSLIGSEITVRIDDREILSQKDTSIEEGEIGFEGYSAKAKVDNIEIFKYSNVEYNVEEENAKRRKEIYVSPNGDDSMGDGSEENPYKTVTAAKKKANSAKKGNTPVDVIFMEGTYKFSDPIEFTSGDSGSKSAPIRYMAKEGDKVVFSGTTELDAAKFTDVTDEKVLSRMYDEVRDKVKVLDLKAQGLTRDDVDFTKYYSKSVGANLKPPQIILNGQAQKISRWPNSGYNVITLCESGENARYGGNKNNGGAIYYQGTQPERWLEAKDVFLEGFFAYAWAGEWARMKSIDTVQGALNFEYYTSYGIKPDNRWAAVHLLEEIDIPGEWYIDFENMLLYYYPTKTLTSDDVFEITTLRQNLVNIKGASYIEFNGIEFSGIASDYSVTAYNATGGNGISVVDCYNVTFKDCVVSHIGFNGIYINSENVTVDGCIIYDIGFSGICVNRAGEKTSLTPGNVVIKNCEIADVCRNTGANGYGGIILGTNTVDVEIKNNIIHNCLNNAIRYDGIGHKISYNEIHNCVNKAADAGAIYAGRNWTEYGTVAEYNYFHGIGDRSSISPYMASSIFWDDYHSGTEFSHNISVMQNYNKTSHVHLGGGVDNVITGNTFVSANKGLYAGDRSSSIKDWTEYSVSTLHYGDINVKDAVFANAYPKMSTILDRLLSDDGTLKLENTIGNNLMVDNSDGTYIASTIEAANTMQPANNVEIKDDFSIFVDPDNQDYRVTKAAKEKYGISDDVLDEDFNLDLIGLQKEYIWDESRIKTTLVYPDDGETDIPKSKAQIAWTKAALADGYRYIVATDPNFENVVAEANTLETSVELDMLENNTTYYWRVWVYNESRQIGCEFEAEGGTRSFTTSEKDIMDKSGLKKQYEKMTEALKTIKEGDNPGQYKRGTISIINEKLSELEEYLAADYIEQGIVDEFVFGCNQLVNGIDAYINPGYTTLNLKKDSDWYATASSTVINQSNGSVAITNTESTEITLRETLSNYNVMCFRTKVDNIDGWFAYGLRALDANSKIYDQDSYYILIKKDIFELQKHGKIYATAPNNGKFEAGKWYDVQFGSITTENGINMFFKLNDEVIFDYLDKNEPQYKPGMFAMFISGANAIDIETANDVSKDMYVMSDAIKAEVARKVEDGDTLNTKSDAYSESGNWTNRTDINGENGAEVRYATKEGATATWVMESGSAGNNGIYKVSYYHIPRENGDKNVNVQLLGYAGDYNTTIDLSQGEAGWVELGTFKFMDADYIGRLSIIFTASGQGELNVSNIKFEKVSDATDMLK